LWIAGVLVLSVVDLAFQLSSGVIRTTLFWNGDNARFTDTGDGSPGAPFISGAGGPVLVSVAFLSTPVVVLHAITTIVALLPQVTLGIVAVRVISRVTRGAVFVGPAAREATIAATALLALGTVGAFLAWVERLAIREASGSLTFDPVFSIDPLIVTGALVLFLVAAAFRSGQRLQREVDGLV